MTADPALWQRLGAHVIDAGVHFAVWAPRATSVAVIGDFNDWDGRADPLVLGTDGVWSRTVSGIGDGELYQFEIITAEGQRLIKSDPVARSTQLQPQRSSIVHTSRHVWTDDAWLARRAGRSPRDEPMSIYEVHLGSWRRGRSYRQLATELVDYVREMSFTHVELMPVMEHPFTGSWGYQVSGYFAPTSRYGDPDDLRRLIDAMHGAGIGVILDWVPAHFPTDDWALARFDGQSLYEPAEYERHPEWGTLTFDFTRREVVEFLIADALFWLEEFHADGLRVDAVASMLYLDYSRGKGEWKPNRFGGNENLEAVEFLKELNTACHGAHAGISMIAEDSTAWPGVTAPVAEGGLGFDIKWNLGWMHDTLRYLHEDPIARQHHHRDMTWSMSYAHTDNFLLPLSHDEVVHGKGSLLRKMPGDRAEQLATLRAYFGFMWAHPGKHLVFMGSELGQDREWSERRSLDWELLEDPRHGGLQRYVRDLNAAYAARPALWAGDYDPAAFRWIEPDDKYHNVFSFLRTAPDGSTLVCIANFAGIDHPTYDVGLPSTGSWTRVLDSAATTYGGTGAGGDTDVIAEGLAHQGCPASATIRLPALSTLWLTTRAAPSKRGHRA